MKFTLLFVFVCLFTLQYTLLLRMERFDFFKSVLSQTYESFSTTMSFFDIFVLLLAHIFWTLPSYLYLYGPAYNHIGFWQGKPKYEICFSISQVDMVSWVQDSAQRSRCDALIFQYFDSFYICYHIFLTFVVLKCLYERVKWQFISKNVF